MGCQTLEDCIQDTANFTGRHQIHEKAVKHLRVLLQCFSQAGAPLHICDDLLQNAFKGFIFHLVGQNGKPLHKGKTGINHGGKLPGENNQVFAGYFRLHERYVRKEVFWLFFDLFDLEIPTFQLKPCHLFISGLQFATDRFSLFRLSNPFVFRHYGSPNPVFFGF